MLTRMLHHRPSRALNLLRLNARGTLSTLSNYTPVGALSSHQLRTNFSHKRFQSLRYLERGSVAGSLLRLLADITAATKNDTKCGYQVECIMFDSACHESYRFS